MARVDQCAHWESEPVEIGGDDLLEVVARICVKCLERLPVAWGCPDCDWHESFTVSGRMDLYLGEQCRLHRGTGR